MHNCKQSAQLSAAIIKQNMNLQQTCDLLNLNGKEPNLVERQQVSLAFQHVGHG